MSLSSNMYYIKFPIGLFQLDMSLHSHSASCAYKGLIYYFFFTSNLHEPHENPCTTAIYIIIKTSFNNIRELFDSYNSSTDSAELLSYMVLLT
jgi:hypothetical protein